MTSANLALTSGDRSIPAEALAAYKAAAGRLAAEQPQCHLEWPLLAAIGRIESDHGRDITGQIVQAGFVHQAILGPVLNGTDGNALIRDTDHGVLDGNKQFDRAVGPMQFIPSTWRIFGRDGNGDGRADPNNISDAALATATYLCAGGRDLQQGDELRAAILGYNHSTDYLRAVVAWMAVYSGKAPKVDLTPLASDDTIGAGLIPAFDASDLGGGDLPGYLPFDFGSGDTSADGHHDTPFAADGRCETTPSTSIDAYAHHERYGRPPRRRRPARRLPRADPDGHADADPDAPPLDLPSRRGTGDTAVDLRTCDRPHRQSPGRRPSPRRRGSRGAAGDVHRDDRAHRLRRAAAADGAAAGHA